MTSESSTTPAAPKNLFDPIQYVPGVGPNRAELLRKMGIGRALDLLFFFPRTYEDTAPISPGNHLQENIRTSVVGRVVDLDERVTQSGRHMLGALLSLDDNTCVRLMWFNQAFRKNDLHIGARMMATGIIKSTGTSWEIIHPLYVKLGEDEVPEELKPLPVYSLTEGLQQATMRKMFRTGVKRLIPLVEDALPEQVRERLGVLPMQEALLQIHWPDSLESAAKARERFVLQELLVLQLAVGMQKIKRQSGILAPACELSPKIHARILNRLGYILTGDQTKAIAQVAEDMQRTIPMNRLLQGDVGCGKTVVAQYAMLLCVANGYQAALMAPTEVLARQHFNSLSKSLAASRVRIGLLTGSLSRAERRELLEQLAIGGSQTSAAQVTLIGAQDDKAGQPDGKDQGALLGSNVTNSGIDLLIGTQALLSDDVQFDKLALVIIDEQHKFGVEQRAKMRQDQHQPHYLVLTATPIPRTIAMTAFGDLDVSIIRDKPPGRSEVRTYLGQPDTMNSWWQFLDDQLEQGRQAFIIAPRVHAGGDDEEVQSATGIAQQLAEGRFAHRRVGLLHGQLDSELKERTLAQFAGGELDILVATTVVEVGIDVPNASVMTIMDADRLGLAQLHQLRGRVGRGRHTGYVCAFASAGCDAQDNERLKAFERTNDGFELAELDLQQRGAGELVGTRQSGASALRIADLIRDAELVAIAQQTAREMLDSDPELLSEDCKRLKRQVISKHGQMLGVSDIG